MLVILCSIGSIFENIRVADINSFAFTCSLKTLLTVEQLFNKQDYIPSRKLLHLALKSRFWLKLVLEGNQVKLMFLLQNTNIELGL